MSEVINIIQNASPAIAGAIIVLLFQMRTLKKEIEDLKSRLKEYDGLNIEATLASIKSDLSWIRAKMEGRI